jgi:hypothetical protein
VSPSDLLLCGGTLLVVSSRPVAKALRRINAAAGGADRDLSEYHVLVLFFGILLVALSSPFSR